jgi:hypothetical protein
MAHSVQPILPRLIVLGYELLVGSLHQPLDVLPANAEARKRFGGERLMLPFQQSLFEPQHQIR